MKIGIQFIALTFMLTGCATKFDTYKQKTNYNLMQCAKMCSTGNVKMIAEFDCACSQDNKSGDSKNENTNTNTNSSNGNTVYINTAPQNTRSKPSQVGIWNNLLQYENNRLKTANRDINKRAPASKPVINNYNHYTVPKNTSYGFGNFGGGW